MTTLSPHALDGNSFYHQPHTIYTLTDPAERIEWKNVRYIGISIDVNSRYEEHLSCSDSTNPQKNAWIQWLLEQGQKPTLGKIETVETKTEALTREQYWIRYAISQGANLLNLAISYTEGERTEIHHYRASCYALVGELLRRGIYVKQSALGYPHRILGAYQQTHPDRQFHWKFPDLLFFTQEGKSVAMGDATEAEFDAFIRQYIPVTDLGDGDWSMGERKDAIQFAWFFEKYPELFEAKEGA